MKLEVTVSGFRGITDNATASVINAAIGAIDDTLPDAKEALRDQVRSAGLGSRLANTWRGRSYRNDGSGRDDAGPAGFIWSNAPDIVDAFARGATIRPVGGAQFLWIPTKNVPRARARLNRNGRGMKGGAMSPEEVENRFNTDFVIRRSKTGSLLAYIDVIRAMNVKRGGFRAKTRGRLANGRVSSLVLMFVLVHEVHMAKLLDLPGELQRWAENFEIAFDRRLA